MTDLKDLTHEEFLLFKTDVIYNGIADSIITETVGFDCSDYYEATEGDWPWECRTYKTKLTFRGHPIYIEEETRFSPYVSMDNQESRVVYYKKETANA